MVTNYRSFFLFILISLSGVGCIAKDSGDTESLPDDNQELVSEGESIWQNVYFKNFVWSSSFLLGFITFYLAQCKKKERTQIVLGLSKRLKFLPEFLRYNLYRALLKRNLLDLEKCNFEPNDDLVLVDCFWEYFGNSFLILNKVYECYKSCGNDEYKKCLLGYLEIYFDLSKKRNFCLSFSRFEEGFSNNCEKFLKNLVKDYEKCIIADKNSDDIKPMEKLKELKSLIGKLIESLPIETIDRFYQYCLWCEDDEIQLDNIYDWLEISFETCNLKPLLLKLLNLSEIDTEDKLCDYIEFFIEGYWSLWTGKSCFEKFFYYKNKKTNILQLVSNYYCSNPSNKRAKVFFGMLTKFNMQESCNGAYSEKKEEIRRKVCDEVFDCYKNKKKCANIFLIIEKIIEIFDVRETKLMSLFFDNSYSQKHLVALKDKYIECFALEETLIKYFKNHSPDDNYLLYSFCCKYGAKNPEKLKKLISKLFSELANSYTQNLLLWLKKLLRYSIDFLQIDVGLELQDHKKSLLFKTVKLFIDALKGGCQEQISQVGGLFEYIIGRLPVYEEILINHRYEQRALIFYRFCCFYIEGSAANDSLLHYIKLLHNTGIDLNAVCGYSFSRASFFHLLFNKIIENNFTYKHEKLLTVLCSQNIYPIYEAERTYLSGACSKNIFFYVLTLANINYCKKKFDISVGSKALRFLLSRFPIDVTELMRIGYIGRFTPQKQYSLVQYIFEKCSEKECITFLSECLLSPKAVEHLWEERPDNWHWWCAQVLSLQAQEIKKNQFEGEQTLLHVLCRSGKLPLQIVCELLSLDDLQILLFKEDNNRKLPVVILSKLYKQLYKNIKKMKNEQLICDVTQELKDNKVCQQVVKENYSCMLEMFPKYIEKDLNSRGFKTGTKRYAKLLSGASLKSENGKKELLLTSLINDPKNFIRLLVNDPDTRNLQVQDRSGSGIGHWAARTLSPNMLAYVFQLMKNVGCDLPKILNQKTYEQWRSVISETNDQTKKGIIFKYGGRYSDDDYYRDYKSMATMQDYDPQKLKSHVDFKRIEYVLDGMSYGDYDQDLQCDIRTMDALGLNIPKQKEYEILFG